LGNLGDLQSLTAGGVYLVVIALVFVESGVLVGFLLPGDSVLFAAGLLAARPGSGVSWPLLAAGVFAAAVAGDATGYWTGHRFGRPWLLRRTRGAARHVERAERFCRRWGPLAVVVARFIPWARTFVPVIAGVARMPLGRFMAANVAGAAVWGVGLIGLGHASYAQPGIRRAAYVVAGGAIALSVVLPAAAGLYRGWTARRREPAGDLTPGRRAPAEERSENRS
jgi:membrane-associated protein